MEDFRAHLRVVHSIRNFDTKSELSLYETWPGSSRYIQRRPGHATQATVVQPAPAELRLGNDFADLVTRSVSEGIERGMVAVLKAMNRDSGMHILFVSN